MSSATHNESDYIEAPVNYLERSAERPVTYLYEPPAGVPLRSGHTTKHWMKILNARRAIDELASTVRGLPSRVIRRELSISMTLKKLPGFTIRRWNGC